jgi:hypothetical protein
MTVVDDHNSGAATSAATARILAPPWPKLRCDMVKLAPD